MRLTEGPDTLVMRLTEGPPTAVCLFYAIMWALKYLNYFRCVYSIYIYIYICVCVLQCVCAQISAMEEVDTLN